MYYSSNIFFLVLDKGEETGQQEECHLNGESDEVELKEENRDALDSKEKHTEELVDGPVENGDVGSNQCLDKSTDDISNDKPSKQGSGTWVSRFLGNKKGASKISNHGENIPALEEESPSDPTELELVEQNDIMGEEETETSIDNELSDSQAGLDVHSSNGELSTIPEGKEEEEEEFQHDLEVLDNVEKPKKKSFGFSSFLTKFGVVSAAVKTSNDEKLVVEDENSSRVDNDIEMSEEENVSTIPSVNGDDQEEDIPPNPIQQYVFGWDEENAANKNNNTGQKNGQNSFQNNPAVSVPVA